MPELGGLAATAVIARTFPQIRVMLLSISEFSGSLVQARQAGAAGYLFKEATQAELVSAIRQVLQGQSVSHPSYLRISSQRSAGVVAQPEERALETEQLSDQGSRLIREHTDPQARAKRA